MINFILSVLYAMFLITLMRVFDFDFEVIVISVLAVLTIQSIME